jgi:beta-glucosidase
LVEIELDKEQLRYWDTAKEQFIVPAGVFDIMVGASSKDIRLQTTVNL